jgi:hypothetical protein
MGATEFRKVFRVSSLAQFKRKWTAFAAAHRRTLVREYVRAYMPDTSTLLSAATQKKFYDQYVQYVQAIKELFEHQIRQKHHLSTKPMLVVPPVPAEQCFLLAEQYKCEPIVKYNKQYFQAIKENQVFKWHLLDLDSPYIGDYLMYNGGPSQWQYETTHHFRQQVLAECKPKHDCHNRKHHRAYSPTKASDMFHVRLPGTGADLTYSVSLAYIKLKFTDMDTLLDFASRITEKWTHGYVFRLVTNNTTKFVVVGTCAE